MKGKVIYLTSQEAKDFLLPRHYSGRVPTISKAFGWEIDGELKAVCTFGKPASPQICTGICGKEFAQSVYELNRLCRVDDLEYPLSQFVSACLRRLRTEHWIIVSYSDTAMHHNGYIYIRHVTSCIQGRQRHELTFLQGWESILGITHPMTVNRNTECFGVRRTDMCTLLHITRL